MKKLITLLSGILLMSISVYAEESSPWAKESIDGAIEAGIVPDTLQSDYTENITRKDFCYLAVQTYMAKTGYTIPDYLQTPFTDIDDDYVTAAYSLDIVSGVGNDMFNPDSDITRQEAAVMLNNLAYMAGVDNSNVRENKFADDEYFANWAEDAIYRIAAINNGDTAVMSGTGDNKFSPWMNYTREQAITTMYRLYSCDATPVLVPPPQYDNKIYVDSLGYFDTNNYTFTINDINLPKNYSGKIYTISNNQIYYILYKNPQNISNLSIRRRGRILYKMNTDGTGNTALTPESSDIYVGHRYIYYVPVDAKTTIVRVNLDGTNPIRADFSEQCGEIGWCSIEADDMTKAYINLNTGSIYNEWHHTGHKYTYDFITGEAVEISNDTLTEWMRTDTVYDGKYKYYIHEILLDAYRNMTTYKLHRCNMDGTGDIILNPRLQRDYTLSNPPVIYKDKVYIPDISDLKFAIFIYDSQGNESIFFPSPVETEKHPTLYDTPHGFIGIKDDRIYYTHTTGSYSNPQPHLHSVNIDGTDDKQLTYVTDDGREIILDN